MDDLIYKVCIATPLTAGYRIFNWTSHTNRVQDGNGRHALHGGGGLSRWNV